MNEKGVAALVGAGLRGVKQIRGDTHIEDGRCALGVLYDAVGAHSVEMVARECGMSSHGAMLCPVCGDDWEVLRSHGEIGLVVHLNDAHGLDFIGIARKLGPDS